MALYHLQVDEDGNKVSVFNDPLPWWKGNYNRFPLVAALARQMLAIPATSAQSERLFSKAGQIVTDRRSSLGSDSVELLLFLCTVWPVVESKPKEVHTKPVKKRRREA